MPLIEMKPKPATTETVPHTLLTCTMNQMVEDKAKAMVDAVVDAVVEIEVVDVEVIQTVAVLVVLLLFSQATR
jgi:hypothetical protein